MQHTSPAISDPSLRTPRSWRQLFQSREVLAWSFYDWANSAFATTVMAGFFPLFFKKFWSAGADANFSTYQLGNANAISSALLAIFSPILGAVADQGSHKKRLLLLFSFLGIVMTGALALVAKGDWPLAVFIYIFASFGFAGANSFYDALLVLVAPPKDMDRVSALGFSLGYLGGGLLFAVNVAMTLKPQLFGLRDATQAVQFSFVSVANWWLVFTVPLMVFVKEETRSDSSPARGLSELSKAAFRQVGTTFAEIRTLKNVGLFLIAYFFYIDGVNTIIRMAVDYGLALGFPSESLIVALLITQFVGFPAAIAYGQIAHAIGTKRALFLAIAIYAAVTIFAYTMTTPFHFYILAIVIGLVQGGIQSLSRSVFGSMVPKEKAGEFFGFFNMLGKFSSMVGPVLVGVVSLLTKDSRLSVLSLLLLFAVGALVLSRVRFENESPAEGRV